MDDDDRWDLLDRTRPPDVDPTAHAAALTAELVEAGLEATLAFGGWFDRAVAALSTWDLWAAAYVLLLGCSDDSFEYLRAWIVGQGRDAFEHARRDPEGYVVHLIEGTDQDESLVAERIEDLFLLDGEPLLYAAAVAHQRLTGAARPGVPSGTPLSGGEPTGEPWDEDDVAARVPRLVAALPEDWLDVAEPVALADIRFQTPDGVRGLGEVLQDVVAADLTLDTSRRIAAGIEAHEAGDSHRAAELLGPVVDDPARWARVRDLGAAPADVAYVAGISRLFLGDVDGAAAALRLGLAGPRRDDRIRRALAQVELSRGDLGAAEQLLDAGPDAGLMDQALVVTLRWRQGRRDDAARLASGLVGAKPRRQQRGQHPWTVAGALVQAAFVLAELGDARTLVRAIERTASLIDGAPPELPLRGQVGVLVVAARRLDGRLEDAAHALDQVLPHLGPGTCDRGIAERERARIRRARGDGPGAAAGYAEAMATFAAAGERWHEAETRAEAGA